MQKAMEDGGVAEQIERQALLAWHRAASKLELPGYDWRVEKIGDALCSVSVTEPSILVNRVLGLGLQAPPTAEQLIEIRRLYRDAGVERFFLHVVPDIANAETEALLTANGYGRYRGWMKFSRGRGAIVAAKTDLSVRRIDASQAADFAAIAAPAFGLADVSVPAVAAIAADPHWQLFMSFDGDRPAGTGAAYVDGQVAMLDWGTTHPDYRRRGSQTALLSERLRAVLAAGCTKIVTMTGEAVPGDPQHSYKNILKAGFAEAYLRENWIPA